MRSRRPGWLRYLERLLPRGRGTRGRPGRRGGQDQRPGGPGAEHLVPCRPRRQDGQEPAAPRHPRQWRADGPDRDSAEASRRGGQPAGRPGRHHHWRIVRGRAGPLRGRDEGPGGQRVRYQLTAAAEARITSSQASIVGSSSTRPAVFLSSPHQTLHPSLRQPNPMAVLHADTERLIAAAGLESTVIRPGMLASNASFWWAIPDSRRRCRPVAVPRCGDAPGR